MTARRAGTTVRVALRGDGDGDVGEAVEAAGATVVDDDVDVAVAVGSGALSALADDPPDVPVLPVDAELGRYSLPSERVGGAVEALADGDVGVDTFDQPTLRVDAGGTPVGRALADVTLMTSDSARISEYALGVDGATVDSFRADGVVAATPLGSGGYARAAGGAVLGPGTGVGVVPVSPFAIASDVWVFRPPLSLSVERDEGAVSLALDGREQGTVDPHTVVDVAEGPAVEVVFVPGLGG